MKTKMAAIGHNTPPGENHLHTGSDYTVVIATVMSAKSYTATKCILRCSTTPPHVLPSSVPTVHRETSVDVGGTGALGATVGVAFRRSGAG